MRFHLFVSRTKEDHPCDMVGVMGYDMGEINIQDLISLTVAVVLAIGMMRRMEVRLLDKIATLSDRVSRIEGMLEAGFRAPFEENKPNKV